MQSENALALQWTPSDHMFLYQHVRESRSCWSTLRAVLGIKQKEVTLPSPPSSAIRSLSMRFVLANTQLTAYVAEKNFIIVRAEALSVSKQPGATHLKSLQVVLNFDGNDIFTFSEPEVNMLDNSDELQQYRSRFPFLSMPHNRAWLFSFPVLTVEFPYQYNFSSTFDKTVSAQKWLKSLHRTGSTEPKCLPPDLFFNVGQFSFVFLDDVFEIKLRDNYELMKDESKESAKRLQLLDRKVAELRRMHGELLPARKIEELYASLERKHIEIYIQRSHRLYASTPMRKALLTWTVAKLELVALADRSLHGHECMRELLCEIDSVSPFPREGLPLVVQWCRAVSLKLSAFLGQYFYIVFTLMYFI